MALLEIPTSTDEAFYTQLTALSGTAYVLTFEYRVRLGRWAMDLGRADGTPIIRAIALVPGCDLLNGYRYLDEVPPGALLVLPFGGDDSTPGKGDLEIGGRCELVYVEPDT